MEWKEVFTVDKPVLAMLHLMGSELFGAGRGRVLHDPAYEPVQAVLELARGTGGVVFSRVNRSCPGGPGAFGAHQVHGAGVFLGVHNGQREHQNAHAAHPVRKAAPIQHAAAQRLYVGEDRRARGGKAAHRLEQSVNKVGDGPAEPEGQRAEQADGYPRKGHGDKAAARQKFAALGAAPAHGAQRKAHGRAQRRGPHKGARVLRIAVPQAQRQRGKEERRLHQQNAPQHGAHHTVHHAARSFTVQTNRSYASRPLRRL